ncbi:MAG: SufD family Fe-S cluster assembly protein [Exilibacterium sp.]
MTTQTPKLDIIQARFQQLDFSDLPDWLAGVRTRALTAVMNRGLPDHAWESWRHTPIQSWLEDILARPLPQSPLQPQKEAETNSLSSTAGEITTADEAPIQQTLLPGCHIRCCNGVFSASGDLPNGVELLPQAAFKGDENAPAIVWLQTQTRQVDPLANLVTAFSSEPALLRISTELHQPIHIWYRAEQERLTLPALLMWLEENTNATVIEHFAGADNNYTSGINYTSDNNCASHNNYACLNRSDIVLNRNARLNYYRLNNDADRSRHIGYLGIEQHSDSQCDVQVLTTGGGAVRNTLNIEQTGNGAGSRVKGCAWVTGKHHCDYQLILRHLCDRGQSDAQLHSLAAGSGTMVSNGLIHIARETRDNAAEFQSRNLLLSEQAQIHTKPELEIYADDVQCSHGASIGQLDEQALFYLRSRGIGLREARHLLLHGFLKNIWHHSGDSAFDDYCRQLLADGLQTLESEASPSVKNARESAADETTERSTFE